MSEGEYEKEQKKARLALDGKFIEIKEQQRVDRNDYNQKLANFKVDVSEMTFERDTLDFFKKQVYPHWGTQISKTREFETQLSDLKSKHEELQKQVKEKLAAVMQKAP